MRITIRSLSCCGGCAIITHQALRELGDAITVSSFSLIEDRSADSDIALVAGSPVTQEDIKILKQLRERNRMLISIGACACEGAVTGKRLSHHVHIDARLPGCPPDQRELELLMAKIVSKKRPSEPYLPVCGECKSEEAECIIERGCLGPLARGGCNAICPTYGTPCFMCRGSSEDRNDDALRLADIDILGMRDAKP
jgi:sulfhydrogenase subunit delta